MPTTQINVNRHLCAILLLLLLLYELDFEYTYADM